jgi:hypothetical protein
MDETGLTLAELLRETHVLDANDREAALAWATTLDRDVARAAPRGPLTLRELRAACAALRLGYPRRP